MNGPAKLLKTLGLGESQGADGITPACILKRCLHGQCKLSECEMVFAES